MRNGGKIKTRNVIAIGLKNIPSIILTAISGLAAIDPVWNVLFATSVAIINAWGEWGQSRVNELVSFIDEHKETYERIF